MIASITMVRWRRKEVSRVVCELVCGVRLMLKTGSITALPAINQP